jgi:hypothetical protein
MAAVPAYQPAWLTEELHKALQAIGGTHQRKKRTTVLRLAEARASEDIIEAEVFRRPECCSRTCWYGKQPSAGVHLPGWRDDPAIATALEAATARAQWWRDQAEARQIQKNIEHLAQANNLLAEYAPAAVRRLMALVEAAASEETARKAANDILDRADEATASKAVVMGDNVNRIAFDLNGLPAELLRLIADGGDEAETTGGSQGGTE